MSAADLLPQEAAPGSGGSQPETCPRCHTRKPWEQSSWCPDCGYYPAVDGKNAGGSSWADALPDLPEEEAEDNRTALQSIPGWFWAMLGGTVVITAFSVFVRTKYADSTDVRGTIALTQLAIGFVSVLTSHLITGFSAMKTDRRINFNDIMLSWFSVWHPTISQLPATCKRIWAMVWGVVAIITATTIIGGIDYSAPFRSHEAPDVKPMKLVGAVAGAAAAAGKKDEGKSMEESLADLKQQVDDGAIGSTLAELSDQKEMEEALQGMVDEAMEIAEQQQQPEPATLNCFIYGFGTDERNAPNSLLFAAKTTGDTQHVAEISTKSLPPGVLRKIATQLNHSMRKTSVIPSERRAIWVEPIMECRLKFYGYDAAGELSKPEFEAIVISQRGRFDK